MQFCNKYDTDANTAILLCNKEKGDTLGKNKTKI